MKCPKCNSEFRIKLASKVKCENCNLLTSMTTVLTIQCGKCRNVFQIPAKSSNFMSVKKDEETN